MGIGIDCKQRNRIVGESSRAVAVELITSLPATNHNPQSCHLLYSNLFHATELTMTMTSASLSPDTTQHPLHHPALQKYLDHHGNHHTTIKDTPLPRWDVPPSLLKLQPAVVILEVPTCHSCLVSYRRCRNVCPCHLQTSAGL